MITDPLFLGMLYLWCLFSMVWPLWLDAVDCSEWEIERAYRRDIEAARKRASSIAGIMRELGTVNYSLGLFMMR